ncbi:MAG: hypothetical protein HYU36_14055 [Planctomycetes bacterium]|nr:hypothetical protein [Planctomycetota bacterium]
MANRESLEDALARLTRANPRYALEAYYFLYEALDFTQKKLDREGHVTGRELLEGIRALALEQFGLMARTVLESWGVQTTDDFGEMVFLLVLNDLLKKTDKDCRDDFRNVYDFREAFDQGYQISTTEVE